MARVAERSHLTADEYLAWERDQPVRHEFFHGEVFAMAGGSMRHNALCASVIEALRAQLRGRCVVLTSDQRVVAVRRDRYVYPDVAVVYGPALVEPGTSDVLANPTIIVEVLSSSTEQHDRGLKWEGYQRIESLTDYVWSPRPSRGSSTSGAIARGPGSTSSPLPANASCSRTTRSSMSTRSLQACSTPRATDHLRAFLTGGMLARALIDISRCNLSCRLQYAVHTLCEFLRNEPKARAKRSGVIRVAGGALRVVLRTPVRVDGMWLAQI